MQFIDLHKQYEQISDNIENGIRRILEHKAFIGGPEVTQLEKMLSEYVGVKHTICCASGTDALTIPLMAYGIERNDAVFVPSFTFFASPPINPPIDFPGCKRGLVAAFFIIESTVSNFESISSDERDPVVISRSFIISEIGSAFSWHTPINSCPVKKSILIPPTFESA